MGFILTTAGSNAASSSNIPGDNTNGTINPSSMLTVDSINTVDSNTIKWFVEITDMTDSKLRSFEMLAIHKFGDMQHNISSILGDGISFVPTVVLNGSNINLNIQNNTLNVLNYKLVRIQI